MALPLAGILGAAQAALSAYTKTAEIRQMQMQFQMGADKAELEDLRAENKVLKERLAVYEKRNQNPGTGGSDSGQL